MNIEKNYIQRYIPHHEKLKKEKLTREELFNYTIGLIVFIIIFIITIPLILYKFKSYLFLQVYFLNIDLVATVLGHTNSPIAKYFKYLYSDSTPFIGYISQTIISLCVLIGIIYVILKDSKHQTFGFTIVRSIFTLLITYLIPNRYIIEVMHNSYYSLINLFNINKNLTSFLILIPGFIVSYLFILLETISIKLFTKPLGNLIDKIKINL